MIPVGGSITNTQVREVQQPSLTWKIDFDKGRIVGMTDGLDAIKQAVIMILKTERYEHLIYSFNYGSELKGLVGAEPGFIRSDLKRRIKEALVQDDRIDDVTDFDITIDGDSATVNFTVVSSLGSFRQEVITNV
jgi:phage baseplate assembly protein W